MHCSLQNGDIIQLVENPLQTGVIFRSNVLRTHSHIVRMNEGPLYTNGEKVFYAGVNGCQKILKVETV